MLVGNRRQDAKYQNLSILLKPDVASPLFSMVLGVRNLFFYETVSLLLVFFFLCVMEGVISCRGERISLLILRGVLRQDEGSSFSLSSSTGINVVSSTSSGTILTSNSQIRLPMMSSSSFYSEPSFSFSMILLKLLVNSMKRSGLELFCLSYMNYATWMGDENSFWVLSLAAGETDCTPSMLQSSRAPQIYSKGVWLSIGNECIEKIVKFKDTYYLSIAQYYDKS